MPLSLFVHVVCIVIILLALWISGLHAQFLSEKANYALSPMEAPIFGDIHSWVIETRDSLILDALFDKIEHCMAIHRQSRNAKENQSPSIGE